mgnify:CR=1 FL=1
MNRCVELVSSDADPEREAARFEASILPEEQRIAALKALSKPILAFQPKGEGHCCEVQHRRC